MSALAIASVVAVRPARGVPGEPPAGSSLLSVAGAEGPPPRVAVTAPAEQLTFAGLCSDYPVFADDGSLVYTRRDEHGMAIRRLDLESGKDTALTDDGGNSLRPATGPAGTVVYLFQKRGEEGGSEVREVSLAGGASWTVVHGTDPAFAPSANALFYLGGEGHSIRRRVEGGADAVLYEAPSSMFFDSVSVSPQGRWIVTNQTSLDPETRPATCALRSSPRSTPRSTARAPAG